MYAHTHCLGSLAGIIFFKIKLLGCFGGLGFGSVCELWLFWWLSLVFLFCLASWLITWSWRILRNPLSSLSGCSLLLFKVIPSWLKQILWWRGVNGLMLQMLILFVGWCCYIWCGFCWRFRGDFGSGFGYFGFCFFVPVWLEDDVWHIFHTACRVPEDFAYDILHAWMPHEPINYLQP